MRRGTTRAAGAAAICALACLANGAWASAGNGIRLGGSDGRLHPFLDYETRYDTNVAYSASGPMGDVIMHVRPGLELKFPGEIAEVEFSGAVDWAQYLGVEGDTRHLSRLYADAGLAALLNPRGAISIRIDDDFRRWVSTSSLVAATAVIANSNALSLSLPWKPGGGALVLTARGQWLLESYESFDSGVRVLGTDVSHLGYNEIRGGLDAQWKFLPRTSATFHGGYFARLPDFSGRPDKSSGVEFVAGVNGLITPHIGASIKAGWGGTVSSGPGVSTFLADVAAEWLPMEGASVSAGYSRGFGLDPVASTFETDSVHATGRIRMAQRVSFRATVRWDRLTFDHLPSAISGHGTSAFLRIEPGIDAAVSKWMTATLAYAYSSRDATFPGDVPMFDYAKNEVWLKFGFTY